MIDPKESLKLWHIFDDALITKKSRLRRDAKKFGWTVYWSPLSSTILAIQVKQQ
jgi:hypothetical protein